MRKIKKILRLNDPPPNPWYEISCYLKTAIAFTLLILGCFFLLSPSLKKGLVIFGVAPIIKPFGQTLLDWEEKIFGQYFAGLSLISGILSIGLGVWFSTKIKIVLQIFKILKSSS